ncbi:hypothetical protein [Fulvimarina sp. MAC3]|uniref:hypothetical protein n=1 Tax=Fulvimarina sp. MAC3 TaxID=3148887 RepID=UPI0031FBBFA5
MPISKDLFLSILSLDAYNRGVGAAINLDGTTLGTAQILANSDDLLDDYASEDSTETLAQAAGFSATAYTIGAGVDDLSPGETVISYRGTDFDGFDLLDDGVEGWAIGAGSYEAEQFAFSTRFLEEISRDANGVID